MKKINVNLKGILAVLLVLLIATAVACNTGTTETEVEVPGQGGGPQPITVLPTDDPRPVVSAYENFGFEIKWPPVKETRAYQVWRDTPNGQVLVADDSGPTPVGSPIIDSNDGKGYYITYDIVDLVDGQATLETGSYTYTVVAIPYVGVRDSGDGGRATASGTIAPKDTPIMTISPVLTIDGMARKFNLSITTSNGVNFFADGDARLDWEVLDSSDPAVVVQSGSKSFNTANTTINESWEAKDFDPASTWDQVGDTYTIQVSYTKPADVTNSYFSIPKAEVEKTYTNLFDYVGNPAASNLLTIDGNFGRVLSWKDATKEIQDVILDDGSGNDIFDETELFVKYYSMEIKLDGLTGVDGATYTIERNTGSGWDTVKLYTLEKDVAGVLETPNNVPINGGFAWIEYGDSITTGMDGNFPLDLIYDREIPLSVKRETEVKYRIVGSMGGDLDWIEDISPVWKMDNSIAEVLTLTIDGEPDTNLKSLYTVTPTWSWGTIGATALELDDDCTTIEGFLDDYEDGDTVLELVYVRTGASDNGFAAAYASQATVKITKKQIMEKQAIQFNVGHTPLIGSAAPTATTVFVFARAYFVGSLDGEDIIFEDGTTGLAGSPPVTKEGNNGKKHYQLVYPQ